MPTKTSRVIPIRRGGLLSEADHLIADVAFSLWLSSAFRGGSPEAALMTALRMLGEETSRGLFLVPKRKLMRRDSMRFPCAELGGGCDEDSSYTGR